jgi:hypothetical protein
MADYFTGYTNPIPAGAQTSMADMLNLASGIQNYQQAQQINPLALQAKQLEVERARQINPLAIREQTAKTKVAEETQDPQIAVAKQLEKQADIKTLSDRYGLNATQTNDFARIMGGYETDPRLKDPANVKTSDATSIMHEIKAAAVAKGISSETVDVLGAKGLVTAMTDPAKFAQYMNNTANSMRSVSEQQSIKPSITVGDDGRTYTKTPGLPAQTPTITVGTAEGFQPTKPSITGADMGDAFNINKPAPLPHPIRNANQPYRPDPTEAADTTAGVGLRQGLLGHLNNTAEANRNLDETLSAITKLNPGSLLSSGFAGTVTRNLSNVMGSSDYQQLSKDLANLQISQIKAQGGTTDAGSALQAKANGTETYNPDVLLNIWKRTKAKQTEMLMQAPALQAFSQKYGDANVAKFQQEWSKNADSKVFEAMNVNQYVKDPKQKIQQINELIGIDPETKKVDPQKRAIFLQKYDNIKKLTANGSLD